MPRFRRATVVAAAALMMLTGQGAAHAAVNSDVTPVASVAADSFWCYGWFNVVNRVTFGGAGWVQEVGVRDDGARGMRVYHPTGRIDEYRFRYGDRGVLGYSVADSNCTILSPGEYVRPEARNGGQWWEGQWRQG